MATRMQQRRGTEAQWNAADPILAAGEIGFETDTGRFKMGNGSSVWSALSYFSDSQDFDTTDFVMQTTRGVAGGIATLNNNGHVPISQLGALIANAPETLNTLEELADAITVIDDAIDIHNSSQSNVHGIADTQLLATKAYADNAVDTHSAATQDIHGIEDTALLATKQYADDSVGIHNSDTSNVHGIVDTQALATKTYADDSVDTHSAVTQDVHGIADTSALATKSYSDNAVSVLETALLGSLNDHNSDQTNVHGIADTQALATKTYADTAASNAQSAAETTAAADATSKANAAKTDAQTFATGAVTTHNSATTNVHGITDTANIVLTDDARLSDTRTPSDSSVTDAKISGTLSQNKITSLTSDLAAKAPLAGPTFTGTVVLPSTTSIGDVSATEIGYLDGVTSAIQTQLTAKAPLASPALTGTPTAPTATAGTNTTQIATTAFVSGAVADLVASAPSALNTLNELATALGNDANFSTTVTNSLAAKAPLAGPTFTGTVVLPSTTSIGNVSSTELGYLDGVTSAIQTQIDAKASTTELNNATLYSFNNKTTSYTLVLSDSTNMVEMESASGTTVTVPANSSVAFSVGTTIDIFQKGAGQVTVAAASGVTIYSTPGNKLRTQYSGATLIKRATDTWILVGDLTA
jgi:hypothetical protein